MGRFEFRCDDPFEEPDEYRRIRDTYSGRCFPPPVFPYANGLTNDLLRDYEDYAILRIVRGRYRSFVFAYGSGSLGTLAAGESTCRPASSDPAKVTRIIHGPSRSTRCTATFRNWGGSRLTRSADFEPSLSISSFDLAAGGRD